MAIKPTEPFTDSISVAALQIPVGFHLPQLRFSKSVSGANSITAHHRFDECIGSLACDAQFRSALMVGLTGRARVHRRNSAFCLISARHLWSSTRTIHLEKCNSCNNPRSSQPIGRTRRYCSAARRLGYRPRATEATVKVIYTGGSIWSRA
jgi:hypothetical protein